MSTVDTSTWNPDPALNESIGDIPLNANASIQQTWQAIQMLMAAGGLHGLQLVTFEGATASADGKQGLVPAPEAGDQDKFLKGDGTWSELAASQIPSLPSSKIALMTGYSKPSSTSSIATTDSLNDAIGKLEKALDAKATDSDAVHKTGNEAISGTKTFNTSVYISHSGAGAGFFARQLGIERGGTWINQRAHFGALDKNSKYIGDFSDYTYISGSNLYNAVQMALYDPGNASTNGKLVEFGTINWSDFYFGTDTGSDNLVNLGTSVRRWKQLFAGTATISTSDERCKDSIADIPDDVLDAWGKIKWKQFRFTDAVKEKGDAARLHSGAVAQDIQRVFSAEGLDASRYGLFCHDRWDAEPEQRDEEGSVVREAVTAGDRFSLRYEEALCMEAAYQRRRADRLEARLADLEARLTAMEVGNG